MDSPVVDSGYNFGLLVPAASGAAFEVYLTRLQAEVEHLYKPTIKSWKGPSDRDRPNYYTWTFWIVIAALPSFFFDVHLFQLLPPNIYSCNVRGARAKLLGHRK
jgi:hypothetical protein